MGRWYGRLCIMHFVLIDIYEHVPSPLVASLKPFNHGTVSICIMFKATYLKSYSNSRIYSIQYFVQRNWIFCHLISLSNGVSSIAVNYLIRIKPIKCWASFYRGFTFLYSQFFSFLTYRSVISCFTEKDGGAGHRT